ncbi:PTS sugar transporter subunit IIA [Streptomyces sp. BI20]|uniref:PTS sugar transporter subunit IIA n=1 Tax=Streptomyces sp. BI20 TaxID=3403460 RepID=UPI003C73645A
MPELSDLLPPEAVRVDLPAGDWREAVTLAGSLLTATGAAEDAYTSEMIVNVEENGPYIVIAPGLAFAHARPSPAVRRTGLSFVRLARPVEFGHESNDPVSLVVGLAARDSGDHTAAMAALAGRLADPEVSAALRTVRTAREAHALLTAPPASPTGTPAAPASGAGAAAAGEALGHHHLLTVCGNGVGTSLFLKSTLEKVLERWGWGPYVSVEATDTISAKGKAGAAQAVLTSREIARTLGDVGIPVRVVGDFTSTTEVDRVLRDLYDV